MNRRRSLQTLGLASLAFALPGSSQLWGNEATSPEAMSQWLDRLYINAGQLRSRKISSLAWQETMDAIYADAQIASLKQRLNFDTLRKEILERIPADRGELFHRVELPGSSDGTINGREPHRVLITKVAHIKKGRSIPPHGHSNMASAFLCISGEFAVKQYDKLEDQENHMVLRQTVDEKSAGVGTWSSISDYRNNVHWLTAKTDDCFLFTSKLIGVEEGRQLNGRINVDVFRAESLGSQTLRAPKITHQEAAELY